MLQQLEEIAAQEHLAAAEHQEETLRQRQADRAGILNAFAPISCIRLIFYSLRPVGFAFAPLTEWVPRKPSECRARPASTGTFEGCGAGLYLDFEADCTIGVVMPGD